MPYRQDDGATDAVPNGSAATENHDSAAASCATTDAPIPHPDANAPRTTTGAAPPAATAPTGANQYATEGQAKFRCVGGTVVWANLDSKIYHFSGNKTYGQTKAGAYMCERDAQTQGMRAAKNEKHP